MHIEYQPKGSKVCGQYCIAIVAGIEINEAIKLVGHQHVNHGTRIKHIVSAFEKLGYKPARRLKRFYYMKQLPSPCMFVVTWEKSKGGGSHWMAFKDGVVYCPVYGTFPYSLKKFAELKGKINGYLRIGPKHDQ